MRRTRSDQLSLSPRVRVCVAAGGGCRVTMWSGCRVQTTLVSPHRWWSRRRSGPSSSARDTSWDATSEYRPCGQRSVCDGHRRDSIFVSCASCLCDPLRTAQRTLVSRSLLSYRITQRTLVRTLAYRVRKNVSNQICIWRILVYIYTPGLSLVVHRLDLLAGF